MPYKMSINENKKSVYVSAWGIVSPEEGMKYIAEFMDLTKKVNPTEYYLLLDGTNLEVSEENSAVLLEGLLQTYIQLPFKVRYITKFNSPIAQSQFKRLLKGAYNKHFTPVETLSDAEKELM